MRKNTKNLFDVSKMNTKKKTDTIFRTLGASNHFGDREVDDYYATEPKATILLLEKEDFSENILEPACGQGHISEVLKATGFNVVSKDLIDRGYGEVGDFFHLTSFDGDIITNPPYKLALEFVEHALNIIPTGKKVAMFLRIQFLESQRRGDFFKRNPPKNVYVASKRLNCAKGGDFDTYAKASALCYAWFVWEKGYSGPTILDWINN